MKHYNLTAEQKKLDIAGLLKLLEEKSDDRWKLGEAYTYVRSDHAGSRFRNARKYEQAVEREIMRRLGLKTYPGREALVKAAKAALT